MKQTLKIPQGYHTELSAESQSPMNMVAFLLESPDFVFHSYALFLF